jgi:2'-5' RNA ligase
MEGFGHFERRVLFMDVNVSQETQKLIADFYTELKKLSWMTFERSDVQIAHGRKLHATLAYGEQRRLFDELWNYIKDEKGKFEFGLDSIAILERDRERWLIHSEYPLKTTPQPATSSQG